MESKNTGYQVYRSSMEDDCPRKKLLREVKTPEYDKFCALTSSNACGYCFLLSASTCRSSKILVGSDIATICRSTKIFVDTETATNCGSTNSGFLPMDNGRQVFKEDGSVIRGQMYGFVLRRINRHGS